MGCMPARGHTDLTDPNEGAAALMLGMKFCFEFDFVNCEQAVLGLLYSPAARQRSCYRQRRRRDTGNCFFVFVVIFYKKTPPLFY
jgi:hypothetical protein